MLLAVDIGNSFIKIGIFDNENLFPRFAISTNIKTVAEDLEKRFGKNSHFPISGTIACSVVPEIDGPLTDAVYRRFGVATVFVNNNFDFGLTINYEPLAAVGTDRLVNSFAAVEKYGAPCVVCSFGTATTIDVITIDKVLIGGMIAPGFRAMAAALRMSTAKLPEIEIGKPENILGKNTLESIRSGIHFAQIGLLETAIGRIKSDLKQNPKVIATGGFASLIASGTDLIDTVDETLTLDGLRMLYLRQIGCDAV